MATPDRKKTPFLLLRTPRTGAYLGRRLRIQVNTGDTKDNNISDILSPKGVEMPKPMEMPRYSVCEQEDNEIHMEEQIQGFIS